MKILVVRPGPQFAVEDVANGWVKGLKNAGHEIIDFDLGSKLAYFANANEYFLGNGNHTQEDDAIMAAEVLAGSAWQHNPDVILVITGYYLPPAFYDIARRNGHKVILMVTESPYEDDRHLLQAKHCDAVILNDTKHLDEFNEICPTFYYGHGFDPDIHKPGPGKLELISEVSFVGTAFPERVIFLEKLDWTHIIVRLAGNWSRLAEGSPLIDLVEDEYSESINNIDAVTLYQSSLMSFNLYRKQHTHSYDGNSCGPREIEMAATGLFFLRETRPESDQLFPMLPTFQNPKELQEGIQYWIAHPDERNKRAEQARLAVADRNFNVLAETFTHDLKTTL